MSWELVERLKERFPAVEPFPRETAHDEAAHGPGEQGETAAPSSAAPTAATARRAPRHDPSKGPVFHVPGAFIPPDGLLEACRALRDEAPYHMDYCSFVSAIDRPANGTIEVVYHLYSTSERHEVLLKVRVPRDVPRVPSVTGIWAGANWHERETYDLFGVTFDSHPDLRRIMMTDDWSGHPLRKDYVYQEPRWLVDLVTQRQKEIEGLGLGERG